VFPLHEAERVLQGYSMLTKQAPDPLYAIMATPTLPDGNQVLRMSAVWNGDLQEGEYMMESIRRLGNPTMTQIGVTTLKEMLASFGAISEKGHRSYIQSRSFAQLKPEVVTAIANAAGKKTSALSKIAFIHSHGVASRIPLNDTAFGIRQDHYVIIISAEWLPADDARSHLHKQWTDDLFNLLAPYALPGGYPNVLNDESIEQIEQAHGSNLSRLKTIKKTFDPNGVFAAQPLAV
jgi:hypothetical protein